MHHQLLFKQHDPLTFVLFFFIYKTKKFYFHHQPRPTQKFNPPSLMFQETSEA